MIPKIIHNIWIQGYEQLPEEVKKNHLLVKKANPEWEFMIWDNTTILKLLQKYPTLLSMYKNLHKYIVFTEEEQKNKFIKTKGIIAKYVILKEYGGVYYDVNLKCNFNFDKLFTPLSISNAHGNSHFEPINTPHVGDLNLQKFKEKEKEKGKEGEKEKEDIVYLVKNNNIYSMYLYYLYPFFNDTEINPQFMAFSKNHPIWENIFLKLKTLRSENQMEHILDDIFVYDTTYQVIYLEKNGDCFEKKDVVFSLQIPFLKNLHYYYKQIYLLILVCLSVYMIHHITVFNSYQFSFPTAVPIPGIVQEKPFDKKKSKPKK